MLFVNVSTYLRKLKIYIMMIFIFSSSLSYIYSQVVDTVDITKYEKAFEYLQNDSAYDGKHIFVSNLVSTNVPRGMFREYAKPYPMYSEWLDKVSDLKIMDEFRSDILKEIFAENNSKKHFDNILFFSTIDENTLMVFIFLNKSNSKINPPDRLAEFDFRDFWFHVSYEYLFFFDDDNKIEKVFHIQVGG